MAVRRNNQDLDQQLDLFTARRPTHDTTDPVRTDGRETLAGTLPEDGSRTGAGGPASADASGSGGKDEGRNGHASHAIGDTGINGATSPRTGLGDGEGEIHPAPTRRIAKRHQEEPPKNLNSYRITEADRLGEGGPKQKFQQNLKAIKTLRTLDAEERPATEEEKAALV